jgi:hypothetical protein
MDNFKTSYESGIRSESLGFDVRHPNYHVESSYIKFREAVEETFSELEDLLLSKHKDYGPSNIAEAPGGAINGLRVRMHDKLARINNLYSNADNAPEHESFEDSFKDMANYAIIGLLVLRGQWPSK